MRQCPRRATRPKENGLEPTNPELLLEDARSISEGLWRMPRLAHDAAETLDERVEDEELDGLAEAVEMREALERMQSLSLELSEELDAYQDRNGSKGRWDAGEA
jgi:hypothetical protein